MSELIHTKMFLSAQDDHSNGILLEVLMGAGVALDKCRANLSTCPSIPRLQAKSQFDSE